MRKIAIPALAFAATLAVAPAASAHVTAQPGEQPAGGFTVMNVRVPNERPEATEQVEVQFPDGITGVRYEPVAGWKVDVKMEKLDEPIDDGHGGEVTEQVDTVTFSGGQILEGQFVDFPLSFQMVSEGELGDKVFFPAIQTYAGGEEVAWTEKPSSEGDDAELERPAPAVTLTASEDAHGGGGDSHDEGDDEGDSDDAGSSDELQDDVDTAQRLGIAGSLLGVLGLAFGLIAMRRRK